MTIVLTIACRLLLATLLFGALPACATIPAPAHVEDAARLLAPIPACVMVLPARRTKTGIARGLSEQAYWRLVFPTFDVDKHSLPENAIPCTGRDIFGDPIFKGGEWIRRYPTSVEEGQLFVGTGGDRLKVVWLRTHKFVDGTEAGPLVLVRPKEDSAEVYAIGVYRAQTARPFFGLERVGPEVFVTVSDEGCTGNNKRDRCLSVTTLYLPRRGDLVKLTSFASARREYVNAGEPGTYGRIEYHLSSSAKYVPDGVDLFEEVTAKDTAGRELRRAELDRKFVLNDVELSPSEESLWPRIFPFRSGEEGQGTRTGTRTGGGSGGGSSAGGANNGGSNGSGSPSLPGLPGSPSLPQAPGLQTPEMPGVPTPSVPTPSVPSPSIPSPSVPTPNVPSPTIPTPTLH